MRIIIVLVCLFVCSAQGKRATKLFSIVNIVRFNHGECETDLPFRNGTCLTRAECAFHGGQTSTPCAQGFGVCCIFDRSLCGDTVSQNRTYVMSPDYPASYREEGLCTYHLQRERQDVCFIRLDFETFSISGPADTSESAGGACDTDAFSFSPSEQIPVICGENSGQHIYLPVNTDEISMNFNLMGTTSRQWKIKVTQIECDSVSRPPNGCLQYHTSLSDRLMTFNFAPEAATTHLANQRYSICIKRQEGYCCVVYSVCAGVPDAFTLHNDVARAQSARDNACIEDYIHIERSANVCQADSSGFNAPSSFTNKYCGRFLNALSNRAENSPICDCSPPFVVSIFTNNGQASVQADTRDRGVCLDYYQQRCF